LNSGNLERMFFLDKFFLNRIVLYLIFGSFFIGTGTLFSQKYIWPTNASRLMTSSFCEFRPRHYHAAIDIKTWNRTGYKVFAIDNGYVMRVRVSAFGYGKAVYLKLRDGNIVVYAHLERFWSDLENYVNRYRQNNQVYRVDLHFTPNQFPVKRGQIIGYTGKTGIGVPHLHFELRNPKNEPINPLHYYADRIEDKIAPVIYQLAIFPFNHRGLIQFRADTLFYNFGRTSQAVLTDTLIISGQVGVALMIYDHANGANNKFSFYRSKMWIDDSLVYQNRYDSFSYAETHLIELDKNFAFWRRGLGIFHNFFRNPGNTLSHYLQTPVKGGIIDADVLPEGFHKLKIKVEDYWGNSAELQMNFVTSRPWWLKKEIVSNFEDHVFLRFYSSEKIEKLRFIYNQGTDNWYSYNKLELTSEIQNEDDFIYTLSIPIDSSENRKITGFQAKSLYGSISFPLFISDDPKFRKNFEKDSIFIESYKTKKSWIELRISSTLQKVEQWFSDLHKHFPEIFWFPISPHIFEIHIPVKLYFSPNKKIRFLLEGYSHRIILVHPKKSAKVISSDSLFWAEFNPGSFYEKTVAYIDTQYEIPFEMEFSPPYRKYGAVYDLQPFDQPINNSVRIFFALPDSIKHLRGLGIYYWDRKKGWLFLPSHLDSSRYVLGAEVTSLEKFTLGQDTIPPVLIPAQKIVKGILTSRNGILTFILKDEMSGIRKESQIQVYLDGNWHLFEYDPEESLLFIRIPQGTKSHYLKISVQDNSGNRKEWHFEVK